MNIQELLLESKPLTEYKGHYFLTPSGKVYKVTELKQSMSADGSIYYSFGPKDKRKKTVLHKLMTKYFGRKHD